MRRDNELGKLIATDTRDARLAAIVQVEREGAKGGWAWLKQPDDGPLPHGLPEYRAMLEGAYRTIDRLINELAAADSPRVAPSGGDSGRSDQCNLLYVFENNEAVRCSLPAGHNGLHWGQRLPWQWAQDISVGNQPEDGTTGGK